MSVLSGNQGKSPTDVTVLKSSSSGVKLSRLAGLRQPQHQDHQVLLSEEEAAAGAAEEAEGRERSVGSAAEEHSVS